MLSQLYLKNFAVIKEVSIDFTSGYNVFTGETGAGKTILVTAINGVLGVRLSKDIIRTGEATAHISAIFSDLDPASAEKIKEFGYEVDEEGILLISREISVDAKNNCKINGRPATLQMLRSVATLLIDIHGQRDNVQLLDAATHLGYLDSYGQLETLKENYHTLYAQAVSIKKDINHLSANNQEKAQRIDLLEYQIQEISSAALLPDEEETLTAQKRMMRNAESIVASLTQSKAALEGEEEGTGISALVELLMNGLSGAARYVPRLKEMAVRVEGMSFELSDISMEISDALEQVDYDPKLLEEVEERLDLIFQLKRKYGADICAILAYMDNACLELNDIKFSDEKLKQLNAKLNKLMPRLEKAADALTAARMQAAKEFVGCVEEELCFLNMPAVKLSVKHTETALKASGQDDIEFLICTNVGELPKPLAKIASGGELSRIMLSIKNVFAYKDNIATSVFDEVDAGVSGKAAQKIGMKLGQVSKYRQVISVTHLAQVAVYGNNHLCISKKVEQGRTFTVVQTLSPEQRIQEIARIISGENITPLSLENAREMLELADAQQL